ncbi:MAG: class I SAM-dependent methyltransferase [Planctomycetales bacterium]|nr:class I SAM-dependent methyltransferase [Planctomycetales bacterium]
MNDINVGQFFDALTDDYTAVIERCFPRYREMLWGLLDYLPHGRTFDSVLELGCGTGNLSVLFREAMPDATIHLVDISGESLEVCQSRFRSPHRHTFQQCDFRDLSFADGSFDLVVSSIAIHHLNSVEKQALFGNVLKWLADDGVFCFADQCAGETDDLYTRHIENWKKLAMSAGSSTAEWEMWMQHMADHDHHDTLGVQMGWLKDVGFSIVDCPWRYLLWSVIQARK